MACAASPPACDVLFVEDDEDTRELVCCILEEEGFRTRTVASAPEALEALAGMAEPPGVFLVDIVMPGMSGIDLVKTLRREPRLSDVPVVVLSGLPRQRVDEEALRPSAWLCKPANVEELVATLRRCAG